MADTLESTGNYLPKDLRITAQPDAIDKDKFQLVATGLKIDESYVFQFQYVFEDGVLSDWSPGYVLNTLTESVPGAPSVSVPLSGTGTIPVTLSTFPANAKRVDVYIIGGEFGTGKVVDYFLSAGTKNIAVTGGTYQVSLITVTPSGINGDPTNTFTISVTAVGDPVLPPVDPSAPQLRAGLASLIVEWDGKSSGGSNFAEGSFFGAKVYVGTSAGFTPSDNNWVHSLNFENGRNQVAIGIGTVIDKSAGTVLEYGTAYYVKLATVNKDGVMTGNFISASPSNVTVNRVAASEIDAGILRAEAYIQAGLTNGQRAVLSGGAESFVIYGSDGTTKLLKFTSELGGVGKLTIVGDGSFTGDISGASGTFSGNLSASSGLFSVNNGILTAQSGTIGGWKINSTQIRSNGVNQISLNPSTPKIALIQGSTLNTTTGLYEGGTEKITIDPIEGIVGPDVTYNGSQVPSFKLTPSGILTLYGSVTITGGQTKTDIENAQATADSKNKTSYGGTAPSNPANGDMWFDTTVGYFKRYDSSTATWVRMKDSDITVAQNAAAQAALDAAAANSAAASALSAANGKNKTYRATSNGQSGSAFGPSSPTSGFNTGDIWFNLSDGKRQYVYDGSQWVDMQDAQIAAAAAASQNKLNKSAYIIEDVSNNITSINSNGIQLFATGSSGATASSVPTSGNRLIINYEGIQAYDSQGPSFQLFANGGTAQFRGAVSGGTFTLTGATSTNYWTAGGFNMGAGAYSTGATAAMINYDGSSTITLVSGTVVQGDDTQSSPDGGSTVNAVSATSRIILSSSGLTLKGIPKLGDYTKYAGGGLYLNTEPNYANASYGMGNAARLRALVRDPYDNQVYAGFAVYYGQRSSAPTGGTGNVGDLWVSW